LSFPDLIGESIQPLIKGAGSRVSCENGNPVPMFLDSPVKPGNDEYCFCFSFDTPQLAAGWFIKDKFWSFTDCISKAIMEIMDITESFSFDRNFEQMGFERRP